MLFTRLGWFAVRRRRWILTATVVFMVLAGAVGGGVFNRLSVGGFDDPQSESYRATRVLEGSLGGGDPNVVLLVDGGSASVDDPVVAAEGTELADRLAAFDGVVGVTSYWGTGLPALRSTDGHLAMVVAHVGGDDDTQADRYTTIAEELRGPQGPVQVRMGGQLAVYDDMTTQIESDLGRAESIAVPLTMVLLVLVFGGLVAAGLPLFVAAISVLGTFLALFAISSVTDVSVYSINLTTALGLGLAIDYSLFIVTRFREELATGLGVEDAVVRTVETAGRTVVFSAVTVAISLAALLVFPMYFLRSFAYAGSAVVVVAALGSVLSLPALLAVLGTRVNRLQLLRRRPPAAGHGFWHRLASAVMRRPVSIAAAAIAVLVVLGLPFAGVHFGLPDARSLPTSAGARQVGEVLSTRFPGNASESFAVVLPGVDAATSADAVDTYAAAVSGVEGVTAVVGATGTYAGGQRVADGGSLGASLQRPGGTWLIVTPAVEPISAAGEQMVRDVRAIDAPFEHLVGGSSAQLLDTKHAIGSQLPLALGIIAVVTFVLLFLVFGSVLVPAKALVLNLLSLSATFGAMVWIFQEGHLSGALGFTPTGQLSVAMPILMFCIAFGLSRDYEVFLLSRIKEEHDLTGDNRHSVAMGLERTGRLVTAAAVLLAITFVAFAASGVSFIKMFGVGLALAVVLDATVIRGLLVPAFMRLAGEANWWAPRWMMAIHRRIGIHEGEVVHDLAEPALERPRQSV